MAVGPTSGLWFLFLQEVFDAATAPRDTSLQRAVLDYLAAGHTWRGGGMFFLVEHLDRFGTRTRNIWNSWYHGIMRAPGTPGAPRAPAE